MLSSQHLITKLRITLGKLGEFWALIGYFWLPWVGPKGGTQSLGEHKILKT